MQLPKKGEVISLKKVKELCIYFDLFSLWDKIAEDPPIKPFKSDSCSGGFPDVWKNAKGKKVSIYEACLKHDLQYWVGYKKEPLARFAADVLLMMDVVSKTERTGLALVIFLGVRIGGIDWVPTKFKWSFGRV